MTREHTLATTTATRGASLPGIPLAKDRPLRGRGRRSRLAAIITWDAMAAGALVVAGGLIGANALWFALAYAALALTCLALFHGYRGLVWPGQGIGSGRLLGIGLGTAWLAWAIVTAAGAAPPLGFAVAASFGLPVAWGAGRAVASVRRPRERVLVVGSGVIADRIAGVAAREPGYGLDVIGCLDRRPAEGSCVPVVGTLGDLPEWLQSGQVDRLIVAFTHQDDATLAEHLRTQVPSGIAVDVVPRLFDITGPNPATRALGGLPLSGVAPPLGSRLEKALKRPLDLVASVFLLLVGLPLMLGITAAIRLGDGGPAIFRQTRVGKDGRTFTLVKFRTMRPDVEEPDAELSTFATSVDSMDGLVRKLKSVNEDPRVTPVGRWLRRTSLDELPQLMNVLRGQMSLVGPRPLRPFEAGSLEGWMQLRQTVRPGMTGLWQVVGRSQIGWRERMQLDFDYVRHWSLGLDVKILVRTVWVVITGRGAS